MLDGLDREPDWVAGEVIAEEIQTPLDAPDAGLVERRRSPPAFWQQGTGSKRYMPRRSSRSKRLRSAGQTCAYCAILICLFDTDAGGLGSPCT